MVSALVSLSALFISTLLAFIGHGMQQTLIPLRGGIDGFNAVQIGALTASYNLGFAIGCMVIQFMIIRAGHIRTFAALISISSIVPLIHPLAVNEWLWYVLRLLTGFSLAGTSMVFESWLNEKSPNARRGRVMSSYALTCTIGLIGGQLLLAFQSPVEISPFIMASVFLSLSVVPLTMTRSDQPLPIALVVFRPKRLLKISPAAIITAFIGGGCINAFFGMGPLFASWSGLGTAQAAAFIGFGIAGGALLQLPAGQISDYIDRRYVMMALAIIAAIAAPALLMLADYARDWLIYGAMLYGAALLPIYSIAVAHLFDLIDPETYVESSSGMLLSNAAGAIIIPSVIGLISNIYGYNYLFIVSGLLMAALALYLLIRIKLRPREVKEEDKFAYEVSASVAPTVLPTEILEEYESYDDYPDVVYSGTDDNGEEKSDKATTEAPEADDDNKNN